MSRVLDGMMTPIDLIGTSGAKNMSIDNRRLEIVFGTDSRGETAEERAKTSSVLFVRSQDELSLFREGAKGRQLSAREALIAFGFEVLEEAVSEGSAILVDSETEPAITFKKRRESLALSSHDIAHFLGIADSVINDIENPKKRNPIRTLELVAQYLGLDERKIAFQRGLEGDDQFALRLKDLKETSTTLNARTVISFNEAAWIIATENRLREWLDKKSIILDRFTPSSEYGTAVHPAFKVGYDLAYATRDILGIAQDEPIENLRELCINKLALPVLRYELPASIAGATIANNQSRGIVVNILGRNENVWVQRATIAHELGHLLWDPDQRLKRISVDKYSEIDNGWTDNKDADFVEQRANAFAAEFLAPMRFAAETYRQEGLRAVMERFGVSFVLARYQAWNGLFQTEELRSFEVHSTDATDDWKGRESYTADFFPISRVPISRTGFFSGLVVLAEQEHLISKDTAIQYLQCSESEYNQSKDAIIGLFT